MTTMPMIDRKLPSISFIDSKHAEDTMLKRLLSHAALTTETTQHKKNKRSIMTCLLFQLCDNVQIAESIVSCTVTYMFGAAKHDGLNLN